MFARLRVPLAIFVVCAAVYAAVLGARAKGPSSDNHYVHLADSFLHGELGVRGNTPPGTNDWACFDTVEKGPCPQGKFRFPDDEAGRYRWYVSFPPFPAAVIAPAVLLWGTETWDRLFWALFAGLGPALLFVLLRALRELGKSERREREDFVLTALFAFGSVFFFTAVQGTVWFSAHVVAVPLLALYLLWSLDARRPWLAGLMLALAFMTRPTTLLLGAFFVVEACRVSLRDAAPLTGGVWWKVLADWVRRIRWREALPKLAFFAVPILVTGLIAMWMNHARFDNPFEFGHTYLQIRWRERIERWGLFHTHYFAKNLSVFLAGMPWLSRVEPYVTISRHGLALWFTTPALLLVLWPKRINATWVGLAVAAACVCFVDLCYQNSGWVQFGYRFALDYLVVLFAMLALSGRRFGVGFYAAFVFAIVVNLFGAATFDRTQKYYDRDNSQNVMFQPD